MIGRMTAVLCLAMMAFACGAGGRTSSPAAPSIPVPSSLAIGGNASLSVKGETSQLSAIVTFADGAVQDQTNAALWTSADPAVATISGTGVLTAVNDGRTVVSATFQTVSWTKTILVDLPQAPPPHPVLAQL